MINRVWNGDIQRIATTPIAVDQLVYSERSGNADHKSVHAHPRPGKADTEIKLKSSTHTAAKYDLTIVGYQWQRSRSFNHCN
ncbi:hypothetical protein BOTNAR_0290g00050 [Botryotinia narcissicola]|uniref:Uncharacterized protein n=1 Tax=Botryotinia narcissicola TaxID=278944 RepID=A0A4Z1I9V5_9HELO|nr:hypothetical protein BOTNAR_0290g00050 [Botryotinia narcissicola]